MPSRRRAFTLVELLVVVGIIAVLIAMLMPALGKVRKHSREVKCAANLHTIGQALTMYTQAYGYYPGAAVIRQLSAETWALWPVRLRQFTGGDQEVFYCPAADERCQWRKDDPIAPAGRADAFHAGYGYEIGEPLLDWNTRFFSYGYNALGTYGNAPIAIQRGLGFIIISPNANIEAWRRESFRELRASRVKAASVIAMNGTS